jgi:hypothetical protein
MYFKEANLIKKDEGAIYKLESLSKSFALASINSSFVGTLG